MINQELVKSLSNMKLSNGCSLENILLISRRLEVTFPDDYIEFMSYSNGATGEIGQEYIEIWSIDEVLEANNDIQIKQYALGLIAFGGDGGNELFAFDFRDKSSSIVQIPLIGMSLDDVWYCSDSFTNFLILKSEDKSQD